MFLGFFGPAYLRRRFILPTLGVRPVRAVGSRLSGARAAARLEFDENMLVPIPGVRPMRAVGLFW